MTRLIVTSRDPAVVWRTRPHWQHPSRREHIYGRVQPALAPPNRVVTLCNVFVIAMFAVVAVICAAKGWRW